MQHQQWFWETLESQALCAHRMSASRRAMMLPGSMRGMSSDCERRYPRDGALELLLAPLMGTACDGARSSDWPSPSLPSCCCKTNTSESL